MISMIPAVGNFGSVKAIGRSRDLSCVGEDAVFAYQNFCMHVGHPLNWQPDRFLNEDHSLIVCASHGALYEIDSGVCVSGPCPGKTLKKVSVEIRDGEVVVRAPQRVVPE